LSETEQKMKSYQWTAFCSKAFDW